jgi:hypothetical protein
MYLDKSDTKALRIADRVINSAMRLGAQVYDWEFFNKTGRINTTNEQTSGTVAVANGGSVVTLTGGTWPAGLVGMRIRIEDSSSDYEFGTRNGTATGTFVSGHQWNGTSVTTGTYVLYKDKISLAGDCRNFRDLLCEGTNWRPVYVSYQEYLTYKRENPTLTGDPNVYAHDNSYLYFWPYPDSAGIIDYSYERWPASAATAGASIDWPDQRIDVLYGLIGLQLDIVRGKMTYDEGIQRARNMAWKMASDDPKYKGPDCIQPMGDLPVRYWRKEIEFTP